MRKTLLTLLAAVALPASVAANEVKIYEFDGSFDDAAFALENAIVNRGLVIDFTSNVGDMLARTKEDVGGSEDLFDAAQSYIFCSAKLSRQVMEADLTNVGFCPYSVFVADPAGDGPVQVGYRTMPEGPMKDVEAMLDEIAREAVGE